MKTILKIIAVLFIIWRVTELSNTLITLNALSLVMYGLLTVVVSYMMGFNALHLNLIKLHERFMDQFNPQSKDAS